MSYVANQLVGKLKHAGPGQRFNILSAILPVLTRVRAFQSAPATDILNSILGIPLQTVLDDFEAHAQHRTPVLTTWRGELGGMGRDVFGAFPLTPFGEPLRPSSFVGSTNFPAYEGAWFSWPTYITRGHIPGMWGIGPYSRKSVDGFFFSAGYQRLGQVPWVSGSEPLGDTQNTNMAGMTEIQYSSSSLVLQAPRCSVIAGDGSHTTGANSFGFTQSGMAAIAAPGTTRVWVGYSIRGRGPTATHAALVKAQNVVSPTVLDNVVGDTSAIGPLAGEGDRFIYFGGRPTIQGIRLASGLWGGQVISPANGVAMTLLELGGLCFGRRYLSSADMAKLYYSPATNLTVFLEPTQNPTRAMGYVDAMSHNQIAKLLDGIAAGTIDPQVATPAAVWDAVR